MPSAGGGSTAGVKASILVANAKSPTVQIIKMIRSAATVFTAAL
jgi:hypothetical protein